MASTFTYSDGVEMEARILGIIRESADLGSTTSVGHQHYGEFAVRYHLCRQRSNLLRHLDFGGLSVAELGAGMGGVSRFLAESAAELTAVEGSGNRLAALRARLQGLENWTAVESTIQTYQPERKFDVVCLVGVLEYSEVYIHPDGGESPFDWVLKHAKSMLNPGGVLLIAIENRLGLKYWAGAAEDHTSRPFDGICGYGFSDSPRTFSRKRLLEMLERCGYPRTEEYFPWPDYKLPTAVLSGEFMRNHPTVAAELAAEQQTRDPRPSPQLFPESLAMLHLSGEGDLADFSNSFLVLASPDPESAIMAKLITRTSELGEVAWHYSQSRRIPMETRFVESPEGLLVQKVPEISGDALGAELKSDLVCEPAYAGYRLSTWLTTRAYFGRVDQFDGDLERFLRWSLKYWAADRGRLRPEALDALATNTVIDGDDYRLFDLEWKWTGPFPQSWFIFRNVYVLRRSLSTFAEPRRSNLRSWYEKLCGDLGVKADFERDIQLDADFHFRVADAPDRGSVEVAIRAVMEAPINPPGYVRQPESLADLGAAPSALNQELARLRQENVTLRAEMTTAAVRIARSADRAIRNTPIKPFLRKLVRGS